MIICSWWSSDISDPVFPCVSMCPFSQLPCWVFEALLGLFQLNNSLSQRKLAKAWFSFPDTPPPLPPTRWASSISGPQIGLPHFIIPAHAPELRHGLIAQLMSEVEARSVNQSINQSVFLHSASLFLGTSQYPAFDQKEKEASA